MATQLHRRSAPERDGFVVISRDLIAASKSDRAVDAPCMGVPPVIEIFAAGALFFELGPGVDEREVGFEFGFDLGARRSDTREPAADGGGLLALGGLGVGALEAALLLDGVAAPDRPDM